jgi:hypothetical protein
MEPQQSLPSMSLPPVNKPGQGSATQPQGGQDDSASQALAAVFPAQQPPATEPAPTEGLGVSAPQIADDVDLIEKEWVSKIQEIIQKTHGDPYERARQIALLKNEYLQKRYQKTIKLI